MAIPLKGDRSAYDVGGYADLHASDINAGAPVVHNPAGNAAGDVPRWDGSQWVAGPLDAGDVTYTPTTAADWDGSADPGDADAALDQLAERVTDIEGDTTYLLTTGTRNGATAQAQTFEKGIVVNENGDDSDTRIESDTEANMLLVDASADLLYLGGTTNGVRIAKGGNLTLLGTATQWEDLRIEPVARATGTNAPSFEKYYDDAAGTSRGVYLYSFDDANAGSEKEVHFSMQLPHAWAGTALYIHVHWVGSSADTTAAPRWGLEYAWANLGSVYGDTLIVYTDGKNYTTAGEDANITAHKHYIAKFAALSPSSDQDGISSILIGRLFRNSSDAGDTYDVGGNKCGLLYVDAHYEVNSLGSNAEYVK